MTIASPQRREAGPRFALAVLLSLAALGYAIAVVSVAARAPDKGFLVFTGRRVVAVTPGSEAAAAGVEPGDVLAAIDGRPVRSTADYIDRLLRRAPGDSVALSLRRPDGSALELGIFLERSPTPWAAIAATALAAVLLGLGLIARRTRPGDRAASRFWRTTCVSAVVYAGVLSWNHLLVHPWLLAVLTVALFFAAPLLLDYARVFPVEPDRPPSRRTRLWSFVPSAVLLALTAVAVIVAVRDLRAGAETDRGLVWTARLISAQLAVIAASSAVSLVSQVRRARRASGTERSQAKWLVAGFVLAGLPLFTAIPVAIADIEKFFLVHYRPFVIAGAALYFAANAAAVLRIRLADVDAILSRSVSYALVSGAVIAVYLAIVAGVGVIAERASGGETLVPHVIAALTAAALFGPLQRRVGAWLDRRFLRDRRHYVAALRELTEAAARVKEPSELAAEVVDRSVAALRAESGALYLSSRGDARLWRIQTSGDRSFPEYVEVGALDPPDEGLAFPIGAGEVPAGALLFGPRRDGQLYSSEDRDLLGALAGQLAVSLENARAFGTIAEMSRTLEAQNTEIRELRDRLEDENRYLRDRLERSVIDQSITGSSRAAAALREQIERLAASEVTVLITGESGTGKGVVARSIHAASERGDGPFIHVDCGAIPAGVIESELFGHERGAFTGASRLRRGHFELADGGALFLDEIGELPVELQPKLLRILEERRFSRVGGSRPVDVDIRVIAATNRDLEAMVAAGEFREDLLYRLRVVELAVPPLRRRKADIEALVAELLPRLARRNHRREVGISAAALERLDDYGWPGNIRELANVIERAVVLCAGDVIEPGDLNIADRLPDVEAVVAHLDIPDDARHDEVMAAIEKQRLVSALKIAGSQSGAARELGMARTTLINKLRRHGLL